MLRCMIRSCYQGVYSPAQESGGDGGEAEFHELCFNTTRVKTLAQEGRIPVVAVESPAVKGYLENKPRSTTLSIVQTQSELFIKSHAFF